MRDDLATTMTAEAMLYVLAGKVGAGLDASDVQFRKLVERLDFGPEREFPVKLPDGTVCWGPGSMQYPPDHQYSKMSALLNDLSHESVALQERIEKATGMSLADGGARAMLPPVRLFRRFLGRIKHGRVA